MCRDPCAHGSQDRCIPRDPRSSTRGQWGTRGPGVTASPRSPQCFMNAVLQCLSSTKPLRDYCLRRDFQLEQPPGPRAPQELTEGATGPPRC